MGKLRFELKKKIMSPERHQEILVILNEAGSMADSSHLFYDLEKHEVAAQVRKDFMFVAQRENIPLSIKSIRGTGSLQLIFEQTQEAKRKRLSSDEARDRIISVLHNAKKPLKKSDIIKASEISPGTWNPRINELIAAGKVFRKGERRDTVYFLK